MRRLLVLAVLLVARSAAANQCPALQAHVVTTEIPLGCPLVLFKDHVWSPGIPGASLGHAGTWTEIELTLIEGETKNLDIYMETIDAACVEHAGYESRPWDRLTLDLGPVAVGDVINVHSGILGATIVEAGPCPTPGLPEPSLLYCQSPVQDYWACQQEEMPQDPADPGDLGDDTVGCNAGGDGGWLGVALVLLVLAYTSRSWGPVR